jgi:hypothetical protein
MLRACVDGILDGREDENDKDVPHAESAIRPLAEFPGLAT